jgi:HEAT repeat protein
MEALTPSVDRLLTLVVLALAATWVPLSVYLYVSVRRAREHGAVVRRTAEAVRRIEAADTRPEEKVQQLASLAAAIDRTMVLRVAAALPDRCQASEIFARTATTHHGLEWFAQQASASKLPRANWRRIAALRLLAHQGYSGLVPLLGRAVDDADSEIAGAAIALLSRIPDMKAAEILVAALKGGRYAGSRVATYLDRFPLPVPGLLRPLLHHPDATVRYWGVTLLARHAQLPLIEADLTALTRDPAPLVRRAAIASLSRVNAPAAVAAARTLLADDVWYVRAHAARALGEANDPELAAAVAPLLADREWWVRTAAKDALQRIGPEVWASLVPYLDHPDLFARNGAAEVLQNIGVLDSLIVLEAATARPSASKVEMLKKIAAAGGVRMTDALLDRVGEPQRGRVRELLASIGLEPAGAPS